MTRKKVIGKGKERARYGSSLTEGFMGEEGEIWPKKSKTRTYLTVDPCITNRVMGD